MVSVIRSSVLWIRLITINAFCRRALWQWMLTMARSKHGSVESITNISNMTMYARVQGNLAQLLNPLCMVPPWNTDIVHAWSSWISHQASRFPGAYGILQMLAADMAQDKN